MLYNTTHIDFLYVGITMHKTYASMHVSKINSKRGDKTYSSILLRSSYRDKNGKSQKKTLANLSHLPNAQLELIKGSLAGKQYVDVNDAFDIIEVKKHGAVEVVLEAFKQLGLASVISSQPSRNRDLVLAMVAARIIRPHTKLATCRWWQDTTLEQHFDIAGADVDELYFAMDWLLGKQALIQGKLVRRHLQAGSLALFDLSSTYLEGSRCPLAQYGYNRDGKKGKLQVNFGLLCDADGRPLSVTVYSGKTRDSKTLLGQVDALRKRFGIEHLVVVGDRGMVTQVNINALRKLDGVHWIGALKSVSIRKLIRHGKLPIDRFDEVNLFEILHPEYPDERLVACRNRALAHKRSRVREQLLCATETLLDEVKQSVAGGRLVTRDEIGVKVGAVINTKKMKKHFIWTIDNGVFEYERNADSIATEAALDGIYVIRTSLDKEKMGASQCVRNYKRLCQVERAFRSIKTVSLQVRPIHHRTAERVKAHLFLCMLAFYVEWHLREVWRELLFSDPLADQMRDQSDAVAPVKRSAEAQRKAATQVQHDGSPVYCFRTLIEHLETVTVNQCRAQSSGGESAPFELTALANAKQRRALELVKTIRYPAKKRKL